MKLSTMMSLLTKPSNTCSLESERVQIFLAFEVCREPNSISSAPIFLGADGKVEERQPGSYIENTEENLIRGK